MGQRAADSGWTAAELAIIGDAMSKNVGANTGSVEKSPGRKSREAQRKRRQNKSWAGRSGPVVVRFQCPACGGPHPRSECSPSEA